jgi:hypothetical protein
VQVSGGTGHLILVSHPAAGRLEEPAEISRAQAEALLELTAGRIEYLSIPIDTGSHTATIQRFVTPASLDLVSVAFKHEKESIRNCGAAIVSRDIVLPLIGLAAAF